MEKRTLKFLNPIVLFLLLIFVVAQTAEAGNEAGPKRTTGSEKRS